MKRTKKELSKGIDHIGVCVVYFCHDGRGNFVMAKRGKNARDERGMWDVGGGAIEFGEDIEATLRREIKEEYCVDAIDYEFLGFRDMHREEGGKPTHWVGLDFKVLVNPTMVKNGEPHKIDEIGWFSLDRLPENLHSQLPTFFKLYKIKLDKSIRES